MRLKKTKTIGLVITDITNPFFTVLARGVEDAASNAGFHVFLCNTDESETKQTEYLTALLQRQVDGFLLVPARSTSDSINLIRKHGAEVVVIDRRVPSIQVDVVRCDSELGAFRLIMHLLELGHKRIAYLGGPLGVSTAEDRFLGYKKAMRECNLGLNEELVLFGDYTQQSGYELTRRTFQLSPRPTAIFAANNFIAIGALQYLRKARINIPHEISLVTFDDLPPSLLVNPFLTTTTQPSYEMGQQAAKLLLTRLNNREARDYR
ncbi:MAG: substrate-binding domain-containing protein [Anaerolineae bacterium]|nr:substrate-binding domain-containing protein [Anaerolineae bacterium]